MRLIDAEALLDYLDDDPPYNWTGSDAEIQAVADWEQFRGIINVQPTITDVAPVAHGRWKKHYRSGTPVAEGYVSTCCDMWNNRKSNYCPNCGAIMEGSDS